MNSPIQNIVALYIGKLGGELGVSDFGAFEFTVIDSNDTVSVKILRYFGFTVLTLINIFHIFLLYFAAIGLNKNKKLLDEINLFLILSIGFILLYLISEVQPRYSFIACWTLVIFSVTGLKTKLYEKTPVKQSTLMTNTFTLLSKVKKA